jgi:hypothetical protein
MSTVFRQFREDQSMALYRDRTTGELKTQGVLRKENLNTSFPRVWGDNVLNMLNVDEVLSSSPPSGVGPYQVAQPNGALQNSDGNWEQDWAIVDMFSDDSSGTKAEKEAAYQAEQDAAAATLNRAIRDDLLSVSDWTQIADAPVSAGQWATYRQALRDITSHANWPHLDEADWPTKP